MAMNMLKYSAYETFNDEDWASLLQNGICDLAVALEGSPRWQQWSTQWLATNGEVKLFNYIFRVASCAECLLCETQTELHVPGQCFWKGPISCCRKTNNKNLFFKYFLVLIRCPVTALFFNQPFILSAGADVPKLFLEWNFFLDVLIKIIHHLGLPK